MHQKNSTLVQQLCKHISNLEEINAKLQEYITQCDFQKEIVYRMLGKSSWEELVREGNKGGWGCGGVGGIWGKGAVGVNSINDKNDIINNNVNDKENNYIISFQNTMNLPNLTPHSHPYSHRDPPTSSHTLSLTNPTNFDPSIKQFTINKNHPPTHATLNTNNKSNISYNNNKYNNKSRHEKYMQILQQTSSSHNNQVQLVHQSRDQDRRLYGNNIFNKNKNIDTDTNTYNQLQTHNENKPTQTPLRVKKSANNNPQPSPCQYPTYNSSALQSPIQSQSRLLNKSIRADTLRQPQPEDQMLDTQHQDQNIQGQSRQSDSLHPFDLLEGLDKQYQAQLYQTSINNNNNNLNVRTNHIKNPSIKRNNKPIPHPQPYPHQNHNKQNIWTFRTADHPLFTQTQTQIQTKSKQHKQHPKNLPLFDSYNPSTNFNSQRVYRSHEKSKQKQISTINALFINNNTSTNINNNNSSSNSNRNKNADQEFHNSYNSKPRNRYTTLHHVARHSQSRQILHLAEKQFNIPGQTIGIAISRSISKSKQKNKYNKPSPPPSKQNHLQSHTHQPQPQTNLPTPTPTPTDPTDEQNIILSIQNTKLRQKLIKLQAILMSKSY